MDKIVQHIFTIENGLISLFEIGNYSKVQSYLWPIALVPKQKRLPQRSKQLPLATCRLLDNNNALNLPFTVFLH